MTYSNQPADTAPLAAADFLAAAFEPRPELHPDGCTDATRGRYLGQLMETEQYQGLHAETQLDPVAAELAAGHFAQGNVKLQEERDRPEPSETPPDAADDFRDDMRAIAAAAEALDKASEEVDELQAARRGLGGDGPSPGDRVDTAALRSRFERIKRNRQLRRIMELAGRYRRLAQAKQRQKVLHGRDDVVGVELGNDLGRLLPSELAALGDDDLELDALRRYLERGLMQRDYCGVEPVGRGPIVVVVDESGSMHGEPIAAAKAFALAMAWIARHQRRWICLVGFSGGCAPNVLTLPPDRWNQEALLDWLEHFYSGGSSRDIPLEELPQVWPRLSCPEGTTDIIQITDALCQIPKAMARQFNAWKEATQAKYFALVLRREGDELRAVADQVWTVPNLSLDQEGISELMSL